MKTIFEQIGEKIELWIKDQDTTQTFFAGKIGVSRQVMSKIINGKKAINIEEMSKIAKVMNVSIDELLTPTDVKDMINDPVLFMMGNTTNENTKEQLQFLNHVMDEMIELEDLIQS